MRFRKELSLGLTSELINVKLSRRSYNQLDTVTSRVVETGQRAAYEA